MASPHHLNMNASSSTTPTLHPSQTAVLEAFIPGYSFLSQFLASYLNIDLSFYLPIIFTLTALVASIKLSAGAFFALSMDYFVSTAEIRLDDEMFNYLMFWMSQQPFSRRTTRFVAGTKTNSEMTWYDDDDENSSDKEDEINGDSDLNNADFDEYWAKAIRRDKYKTLRFTPAVGRHWFRYKGRLLAFTREQDERNSISWIVNAERLYLSCFGRDPSILKELLNEAQRGFVERDGNRTIIYRGQKNGSANFDWVRCMARPARPLSTVVLDREQKDAFLDDVKEYLHPRTRRWYANRGIPYRRGYLLHGPPGTGKTSLCFAASGLLGLKIYLLSLNSKSLNEDGLASLFQSLPRRCVVLLEDVDSAGMTKKRSEETSKTDDDSAPNANDGNPAAVAVAAGKPPGSSDDNSSDKGVSLSALLNIIDGVAASEGRILVMTTNHIEKLDPALLRPGRVDMTIAFGYSDTDAIQDLFCSIYSTLADGLSSSTAEKHMNGNAEKSNMSAPDPEDKITALTAAFSARVPSGEFTAAEIQGYLLKHKDAPQAAIDGADAWVQSMRERRKETAAAAVTKPNNGD